MTRMPAPALNAPADAATEVPPAAPSLPYQGSDIVDAELVAAYVPRILQQHLLDAPSQRSWSADGSAAFVDISGFTRLSEQLARKGREGSEQITEAIGTSFESILRVAYENGASLLKFGGDSLLLWFQDERHVVRACRATVLMRRVLREVGRIEVPGARVTLRMSQGVHSGRFHFFAVGTTHVEFLPIGPGWSRVVEMEHAAQAGEILISPETAALLPGRALGEAKGPGVLLLREPPGYAEKMPLPPRPPVAPKALARCLSPAIRAHVQSSGGTSEHRPVTIAFIRIDGTDALIEERGTEVASAALHELVSVVETATEEQGISLLGSDVDIDGGKLILTAGAPSVTGDDEERMLLALRRILDADLAVAIRAGVNRGAIFAGDIGPRYRRTYTVMGDAVNLAARLMAKAEPGHVYATADVLERSNTLFATTELAPMAVKGKTQLVRAWSVGRATGSRTRLRSMDHLPLIGRDAELATLRRVLADAHLGQGRLVELVGEAGVGKTRLLETLRAEAHGFRACHAVCEAYTASTPYAVWREILRELLGFGRDDPDDAVAQRLREVVAQESPHLLPWLPLVAIAFGLEFAATAEVEMLAEKNRRAKLHETVAAFLAARLPGPGLFEIENAHHMDLASAELFAYLAAAVGARPWVIGVARRPGNGGFAAPAAAAVLRIDLEPLAAADALKMTRLATDEHPLPLHVLEVVAQRSGGNPQFLRDLLRSAIESGGVGGLPDSAEAATLARIDALAPEDRALVRHAAVFGLTFHPRMLTWLDADGDGDGEGARPDPGAWRRLREFFNEEGDGYLRFRRSLLRDTAYQGLPYKLRRRLHGEVAAQLEREAESPEDAAGILSLHYFEAHAFRPAWQYAAAAGRRAQDVYAYVEATELYTRALDAARRLTDLPNQELAVVQEALGDAWTRAGEFGKAIDAYAAARRLVGAKPLAEAELLLKRSRLEEKLGKYPQALRWAARARKALDGLDGPDAARQVARSSAWYATVLQAEGRNGVAIRWAQRAIAEAEAVDDPDALGAGYFVAGWANAALGKDGWEPLVEQSLHAYQRSGDRVKQAVILSNVGVVCQGEGRWDEAMDYYERGRDASLKIGDTFGAAVARMNVAEILADRGELAEAEASLQEVLHLWRASKYRYFLGACLSLLGRVALRKGRADEACGRFEEAKGHFEHVGAEQDALAMDARMAECALFAGDGAAALVVAERTLARAVAAEGVAMVMPLLERVRGEALVLGGETDRARSAFEASLAAARSRRDRFEVTLTLLALIRLDRHLGAEPPTALLAESESLLASLKVRAVPAVPSPAPRV